MATWIVHLRIAENLLAVIPGLEPRAFAIGNLAPDSGIPDENWEHFNPDPKVTHFRAEQGTGEEIMADLVFFRRHLMGLCPGDERYAFRLGYFCHLVTDNLWRDQIDLPTRSRYAEQFAADRKFIWEVKRDWYGLDFVYVHSHPESLFWKVFLGAEYVPAGLDFLPDDAVRQRMAYIKEYYQRRDEEILQDMARPMVYLPQAEMDRFVEGASEKIYAGYRLICSGKMDEGKALSVLEM